MGKKDKPEAKNERKSGFDEKLDKVVRDLGAFAVNDGAKTYLTVRIMSYDGGPEKVAIDRWTVAKDTHTSLGRLTLDEATTLRKLLKGI